MSALSKHLPLKSQAEHDDLYEWLACTAFGNGLEHRLFSPARDIDSLKRIRKAIIELEKAHGALSGAASQTLLFRDPLFGEWLHELSGKRERCLSAISDTLHEIDMSDAPKGRERMNIEAISLVSAARELWAVRREDDVPNGPDLNEASPFADFVNDLFVEFGLDASARSAFKAWAKIS
jgi:hypothetical protein